jgi:UDPglucose--hexose-1-phosphate uridylyltransferase
LTPPETFAFRKRESAPDSPGWSVRVVTNKYPALALEGVAGINQTGLYLHSDGIGIHEVVIETPEHDMPFAQLPTASVAQVFAAVAKRFRAIRQDPRIVCAQYFKNHGAAAGASLPHPHSQIVGMPVISKMIVEELAGAEIRFEEKGECIYCSIIDAERAEGVRLVADANSFIALTPYASRFPYEIMILPYRHGARFEETAEEELWGLAAMVKNVLGKLDAALDHPPFNLMLHTAPFTLADERTYHWHIRLMPILARPAGFEWGSGFHINSVPPEEAATILRESV